jgi:hypothetical protein
MVPAVIAFGGIHAVVGGGKSNFARFRFLGLRSAEGSVPLFSGIQLVPRHVSCSNEIKWLTPRAFLTL